jgi:hypothetical protein
MKSATILNWKRKVVSIWPMNRIQTGSIHRWYRCGQPTTDVTSKCRMVSQQSLRITIILSHFKLFLLNQFYLSFEITYLGQRRVVVVIVLFFLFLWNCLIFRHTQITAVPLSTFRYLGQLACRVKAVESLYNVQYVANSLQEKVHW